MGRLVITSLLTILGRFSCANLYQFQIIIIIKKIGRKMVKKKKKCSRYIMNFMRKNCSIQFCGLDIQRRSRENFTVVRFFIIPFNVMYMYFEVVWNLFNFSIQKDKKNLNMLQLLTYVLIWSPNHGSIWKM